MASGSNNWNDLPEKTRDIVFNYLLEGNSKSDLVSLFIDMIDQEALDGLVEEVRLASIEAGLEAPEVSYPSDLAAYREEI